MMERLPNNAFLINFNKVAASSMRIFFKSSATYARHRKLSINNEVLKALPGRCLFYLSDHQPCTEKRAFMQQLSFSGHATYTVALASQFFQQMVPDLKEIKRILHEATIQGSNGDKYFMMIMLNVQARGRTSTYEFFSVFKDLFERRKLANCKRAIMNIDCCFRLRALHPGLEYRFMSTSYKTYKGDGRKPNTFSLPPGSDDYYSMTDIFLSCRFYAEILWFLVHFRFSEGFKLWSIMLTRSHIFLFFMY